MRSGFAVKDGIRIRGFVEASRPAAPAEEIAPHVPQLPFRHREGVPELCRFIHCSPDPKFFVFHFPGVPIRQLIPMLTKTGDLGPREAGKSGTGRERAVKEVAVRAEPILLVEPVQPKVALAAKDRALLGERHDAAPKKAPQAFGGRRDERIPKAAFLVDEVVGAVDDARALLDSGPDEPSE